MEHHAGLPSVAGTLPIREGHGTIMMMPLTKPPAPKVSPAPILRHSTKFDVFHNKIGLLNLALEDVTTPDWS